MIRRIDLAALALALLTLVVAIVWAFPLYWSFMATVVPREPGAPLFDSLALYADVLVNTQIGRWYLNSLVTSGAVTALVLAISASCSYAISQLRFRGRKLLWIMILVSFMIPVQALIVNHFLLMHDWGLINTWLGVILPQLIAPLAVIVYKQFFDGIPHEYREAAQMDAAPHWRILLRVYLPLNWGVTAALAIITFIGAWNAFLWPFLVVTREDMMNVTVGATAVRSTLGVGELAAALLIALPVAVFYLVFQRRVTEAVMISAGLKG